MDCVEVHELGMKLVICVDLRLTVVFIKRVDQIPLILERMFLDLRFRAILFNTIVKLFETRQ